MLYNCSGHGECSGTGECRCHDGFAGVDCSWGITTAATTLTSASRVSLPAGAWHFHLVPNSSAPIATVQAETSMPGLVLYALSGSVKHSDASGVSRSDLPTAQRYTVAWRLPQPDKRTLSVSLNAAAGSTGKLRWVLGVHNDANGFHAPTLNYSLAVLDHGAT